MFKNLIIFVLPNNYDMISINFNNIPSRDNLHQAGRHNPLGTGAILFCEGFSS
jgi:hypothetical protein